MGWDRTDGVYIFALALLRGVEMGGGNGLGMCSWGMWDGWDG